MSDRCCRPIHQSEKFVTASIVSTPKRNSNKRRRYKNSNKKIAGTNFMDPAIPIRAAANHSRSRANATRPQASTTQTANSRFARSKRNMNGYEVRRTVNAEEVPAILPETPALLRALAKKAAPMSGGAKDGCEKCT